MKKNLSLKSNDHEFESYNKLKNLLLKITQLSPWQINSGDFFARCAIFVRHHYFQMALKGTIFVGCIWWLSNWANYLQFYQKFEERLVKKCNINININILVILDTYINLVKYLQKVPLDVSINWCYLHQHAGKTYSEIWGHK